MKISTMLFLFFLFLFVGSYAQTNYTTIDSVASIYQMLVHSNNKEKIILQTDRKIYMAGERIWFKAFVVNAADNKVDLSSKMLFTDFADDHDNFIAKLVLNNSALNTNGAINLPDTLNSGFYWLRCYTNKILAEGREGIYLQPVYIINKRKPDTTNYKAADRINTKNNSNVSPVIHFLPERLTAIPGISSTGVLQIADADNNPLTASCDIVNSADSIITNFTTNHFGLTRIALLYDINQKYTAVFHVNEHDIKFLLPPVDRFSAQLSVANQTEKNIKAFVTLEDSIPQNFRTIILGINRDSLCYASVGTGSYGINIPLDNFPGGISSLLLFNQQKQLLAERKIFINKDNYIIDIKTNKKKYAARDNAALNISVTNANAEPLVAALNISVQDAWLAQLSDSIEINNLTQLNEFQLNNWLKLYRDKTTAADIDLLMMSNKSLYNHAIDTDTANKEISSDDDEKILNLIGKITDRKDRPFKDWIVTAISKNQTNLFIDSDTTKENGTFKMALPQDIDSLPLSLQIRDKHNTTRTDGYMLIDSFPFPAFATPVSLKQQFMAYNIKTLAFIQNYHVDTSITFQGIGWLKPITVTTIAKKELNYDESKRINSISQILASDKFRYGGHGAVSNALLMVPGITYLNGDISIFGTGYPPNGTIGRPLLVVDGVAIGDVGLGYFEDLNPAEIDFIEVLRGGEAGIYGMRGGNGVISVNTRKGPSPESLSKSYFTVYTPLTYHVCPQFAMPDYSNKEIKNSNTPDPRNTIYWNGNLMTDLKGQASVNFYAADKATNYTVTVTGLTSKGDIIYKRIIISRN